MTTEMIMQDFRDWFAKDTEIVDLLDAAVKREPKDNKPVDNVNEHQRPTGNSKDATLRRLRKDHAELHRRVIDGELTANAAAIEAGFRKPMKTIPVDTPSSAVQALLKVWDAETWIDAFQSARRTLP